MSFLNNKADFENGACLAVTIGPLIYQAFLPSLDLRLSHLRGSPSRRLKSSQLKGEPPLHIPVALGVGAQE